MCGLVGVVGTGINFVDSRVFKQMLFVDALRGPHSTGVAVNGSDNEVQVYKRAVNSTDFLQLKAGETIASTVNTDFLLGHNRYATQGAINDANAHPFTYGNVTLAHNGTLTDQSTLPDHTNFKVDSENIAYAMGLAEKPEDVISKLIGAFALTWWNDNECKFYIVRNDERPMYVAHNKSRDVYYYSSEKLLMEAILERNKIEYTTVELKEGILQSFDFDVKGKCKVSFRKVPLHKPVKKVLAHYNSPANYSTYPTLVKYKLKVGEIVEFYSHGLPDTTPTKLKGIMYGAITDGQTGVQVKCFSQPNDALAGYYTGIVQSIIREYGVDTLIVTNPWLLEIVEDDKNNVGKEALINEALGTNHVNILSEQTHV